MGLTRDCPHIVVDLIVNAKWVVTIDNDRILEDHSIVVDKGEIVAILSHEDAIGKYDAKEVIEKREHALMPGFVNAHTHVGMTLLRGYADDLGLADWLQNHIWPAEGEFMHEGFVRDGTKLALAEMIRSGTTLFNDMYFFQESTAESVIASGMRAVIGIASVEFPTNFGSGFDDYLKKGEAVLEKYKNVPRIKFSIAPHAPFTVSDANLEKCLEFAEKFDTVIHTHLHETKAEVDDSREGNRDSMVCHQSNCKCTPFENFDRLGLIGPRLVAAHAVHMSDEEIAIMAQKGASVAHCPSSNLKLSSGMCRTSAMVDAGVNVAIGSDSVASNNVLDMWSEMKLASLLAKGVTGDATTLPAKTTLRMATINGAKALGLDSELGSLMVGKRADFIAVKLITLETLPLYDVESALVFSCSKNCVTDVWVDGTQLMEDRKLLTLDEIEIIENAQTWGKRIQEFRLKTERHPRD
eukprot:448823_1